MEKVTFPTAMLEWVDDTIGVTDYFANDYAKVGYICIMKKGSIHHIHLPRKEFLAWVAKLKNNE